MKTRAYSLPAGVSLEKHSDVLQECPSCGASRMLEFYQVEAVPVHSCLLISDRDEAVAYPTGQLCLSFCGTCGFISNTSFDPKVQHYSAQYEETQGFSARFRTFAHELCDRLINHYDIRGRRILEIGCGKGEFLAQMCVMGDNTGVGIDPAYVPERYPSGNASSVTFIQDFYSARYAHLEADVICCRHTLEHIGETRRFLRTIRDAIGQRERTLVIFEVPDTLRILREGAFWDLYYEHCSYFTPGSLARLFRATGFEVDQLYLDFDDQYIITTAYPSCDGQPRCSSLEEDVLSLKDSVESFTQTCGSALTYWSSAANGAFAEGRRTVLWGSGSKAVAFLTTLGFSEAIEYVVDINPYKHGKFLPCSGHEIVSPEFLVQYRPDQIIVMNPVYCEEIRRDLSRLGLAAELLPVTSCVTA